MNESVRRRAVLVPLLLAALTGACGADRGEPPLAGATMGGPFTLTSHEGRRVSDADFAGRYRLVYFGFTHCPDVCPIDVQALAAGLRRFEAADPERAARVQPLFVTVDPSRDTPEALRAFVANFHPRLIGLTGTEEEIGRVASRYGVYRMRGEPTPDGGYLVNHSRTAVLYGPQGAPVAAMPTEEGPEAVAAELDRWVR